MNVEPVRVSSRPAIGRAPNLAEKSSSRRSSGDAGPDGLYRDGSPVPSIRGQKHDSHATGADLADDAMAVAECLSEVFEAHRHGGNLGPMARLRESVGRRFFSLC
jgi:hypothetical protein